MSLRGRVIRRQKVSCYLKPQSIQEQQEQYNYLARALRVPQYEVQYFDSFDAWKLDMNQNSRFVRVKDIYPAWEGDFAAVAVRLPVDRVAVLDFWFANIGGTAIPTGWDTGFIYKRPLSTGVAIHVFDWSGKTIAADRACRLTVTSTPGQALALTEIGGQSEYSRVGWTGSAADAIECYFVHPFLTIPVVLNGSPTEVVSVQPKVY